MSASSHPSEQPLLLQIEKLIHGGAGLAHEGSRAVFVPHVLPGEAVRVAIDRSRKDYAEARLVEVVTPSPNRIAPPCPVYGECGGCQLQHVQDAAQLRLKREVLAETLRRVGGLRDVEVPPVIASPDSFGYRNRARFAVSRSGPGSATLAFYHEGSHRPVAIRDCLVLAPPLNQIIAHLNKLLPDREAGKMGIQEISMAASATTGEVVLVYRAERGSRDEAEAWFDKVREGPNIRGQLLVSGGGRDSRRWIDGETALTEVIAGHTFRISHGVFAQANWKLNESLAETVRQWGRDNEETSPLRVLELYAGIGNFGLLLARDGALVTLVEGNRIALADARENAKINHIGRCRFRQASAEEALNASTPGEYDLVLIDPPRTGLSKEALAGLLRLGSKRILYISCDPATLARDLHALQKAGYRIARLQGYDMFPQTMHIETVTELVRQPIHLLH